MQRRSSPRVDNEEQLEILKEADNKDEAAYWRHVGKVFAIHCTPWLSLCQLEVACNLEHSGSPEDDIIKAILTTLNNHDIEPAV